MSNIIPIKSYVAMIAGDEKYSGEALFSKKNKKEYVIPVYQRPYSWGETNIDDFLHTIMDGFYNNCEMKFFGTMQFNVDDNNISNPIFQIVDGQQRMTTMILFAHLLEILSERKILNEYGFLLHSHNHTNADYDLQTAISQNEIGGLRKGKKGKADTSDLQSTYDVNIRLLNYKFEQYYNDCDKCLFKSKKEFANNVLNYFLSSLYVVVLETNSSKMRLPEIVSIFNTINTTGLELNDSDIFKLQYFDYLNHLYPDIGDSWMDKLQECYDVIDKFNSDKPNKKKIGISWVLDIYKHCICAKYGLKFDELSKSNERFFDDLFRKPEEYKELLEYEEFKRIVVSFVDFWERLEKNEFTNNVLWALTVQLIDSTRYSRYWTLPFVYTYFHVSTNSDEAEMEKIYSEALENSYAVARLLIVNSINFAKVINPVQSIMCNEILPMIARKEKVIQYINDQIWESPYLHDPRGEYRGKTWFTNWIERDTFSNTRVGLICLLIAIKKEIDNKSSIVHIKNLLFNSEENPYDIEHIESRAYFMNEPSISEDDKLIYNGLGNLVILERSINREMGRKQDLKASDKDKPEYYQNTKYIVARDVQPKLKTWDLNTIVKRKEEQKKLLLDLLSRN